MNSRFDPKDARPIDTLPPRFGTRDTVKEIEQPLTTTDARQGARGTPVLKVLLAGIVLALLAWGGAEWWGAQTAPPAEQTATPPAGPMEPATPDATPSSTP
ncbi:hypothetical protein [Neorhizobium sp. JUb45]|uniref:hypothetical protein n=1 Tax=unclassified Neorhizobium TaxID=2629175 RepID=UPI0010ECA628|nr:hypothetical protein EDF70_104127 [Neorhizobium sp. JUb45]